MEDQEATFGRAEKKEGEGENEILSAQETAFQ